MGTEILSLLSFLIAPLLSGILLFLAFPKYDLWWLAWVGLTPLFTVIIVRRPTSIHGFLLSLLCGIVFFAGIFNWILEVPGYEFYHHAILIPYLGMYFGIFGLVFTFISRRWSLTRTFVAAPFLWISLEYIRSNLSFLALPWALLAHSQYRHPFLIQISPLTGAYGESFLIVLVNLALAYALLALLNWMGWYRLPATNHFPNRAVTITVVCALALVGVVFLHGWIIIARSKDGPKIKVSVVQGNIDQEKKRDQKRHAKFIMQRYEHLTRKAAEDDAELIVWPEAATPGNVLMNRVLKKEIESLIREIKTHFLIGSSEFGKFAKNPRLRKKTGNTALFFSPEGEVIDQYLKINLVPFGEYLPYQKTIPWPDFIVPRKRYFEVPGKDFTLFELDGARFGVIICWENVFPDLFRTFVKDGANFMLNITNEGWFGDTAAPYQMLAISVFRAVENRVALVRAANTGISCFIDPYGRIAGRVTNSDKDTFVKGYLTQEVSLSKDKTFYTIYGDIFVYINLIVAVFMIALAVIFPRRSKPV